MASATMLARLIGDASQMVNEFDKASKRVGDIGAKFTRAGTTLTAGLTVPIVGAGAEAVHLASDLQDSMAKITGLVGVPKDQVAQFKQSILALSPATNKSTKELADGMFYITSAGLRGQDAIDALTVSAKASAGGLGDVSTVADAVTSAVNAYGSSNLSAAQAGDILTAAVREGKLEADSLAPVLGRLLPTASAMGIGFDQVAGSIAVMSRTGLGADEAATSLSAVMSALIKPSAGAKKAIEDAGLSFDQLRTMAAKEPDGLVQVMRLLSDTFDGNDDAMATIIPNVRAFRGVMNVLAQDTGTVDSVMQGVSDSTGSVDRAFQAASETGSFKWQAALKQVEDKLIPLGDKIIPLVAQGAIALADAITPVVDWFSRLPGPAQGAILVLLGLLAVMGPLLLGVGMMATGFSAIIAVAPLLGAAITLATGPFGLIALAIAAVIAGGVLLITHWDKVKEAAGKVGSFIMDHWQPIAVFFGPIGALAVAIGFLVTHFDDIKAAAVTALDAIIDAVNGFIRGVNAIHISFPGVSLPFGPSIPAFDIGLPHIPEIPRLQQGGLIVAGDNPSGIEAVVPLERARDYGFGGGTTYQITVNALDPRSAADAVLAAIVSLEARGRVKAGTAG